MSPKVEITVKFSDKDLGYNCGILTCENGNVIFEDKNGDLEFACEVKGLDYDEVMSEQENDNEDE